MIEDIKILLGDSASNFSDSLIALTAKQALAEVESYCNRVADAELEMVALRIAIIKINRINTEGLASQGFSGVSESYIDGYPQDILSILNRKRKLKVV